MATKKEKKPEKIQKAAATRAEKAKQYFAAVGRRKAAISRARLFEEKKGVFSPENISVNEKKMNIYFPLAELQDIVIAPLKMIGEKRNFTVSVRTKGGGIRGQAEATRLAIARALAGYDNSLRKSLKDMEFLTRDSRRVERKKSGLKKARRAPQWQKR